MEINSHQTGIFKLTKVLVILFAGAFIGTAVQAESTHHFEINKSTPILAGAETTFSITSHRGDGSLIQNNHAVKFIVCSSSKAEEHLVNLENGIGKIGLTFADPGEYLIRVVDQDIQDLTRSGSFKVERAPLKKGDGIRP